MRENSFELKENPPGVEDYMRLRSECGLSAKSFKGALCGLEHTIYGVCILLDGDVVGMGRVIGDRGCFLQIVDMAVLPAYQGQGLGARIMDALMKYIRTSAPSGTYVSLIADKGVPPFYERFGFERCAPDGEGMFLRIE